MNYIVELGLSALLAAGASQAAPADDRDVVSKLDIAYQAAVKINDAETMDQILHPEFALVRGDGRVVT
ncbi:MAG: hypothetical protein WA793_12745, partial [Sphingorhabdus sp.]|uniref:hypothetical protein n=1 Tax=Sphingorhabdus sp. TaxID=1902408 RepID=UPI003CA815F2